MGITGTLTEFLLTLALGALLLLICAIIGSGIDRNEQGWKIPKAHPLFSWAFFIFAFAVIGFAIKDKYFRSVTDTALIEKDRLYLNWQDNKPTNTNHQIVWLSPAIEIVNPNDLVHVGWEWDATTTLASNFSGTPEILISLVDSGGGPLKAWRYCLETIALPRNQFQVKIQMWPDDTKSLTDTAPVLDIKVECLAVGTGLK